jgi:hypothetical protein
MTMMILRLALLSLAAIASAACAQTKTVAPQDAASLAELTGLNSWKTEIVRSSPGNEVVFFVYQQPDAVGARACKLIRSEFFLVPNAEKPQATLMTERTMLALRSCDGIAVSDFRQVDGRAQGIEWEHLVDALRREIPALGGHVTTVDFQSAELQNSFSNLAEKDLARFAIHSPSELSAIFFSKATRPELVDVRLKVEDLNKAKVFVNLANGPDPQLSKP